MTMITVNDARSSPVRSGSVAAKPIALYDWDRQITSDPLYEWEYADVFLDGVMLNGELVLSCLTGENGMAELIATNPNGDWLSEGNDIKRRRVFGKVSVSY